MVVVIVVVVVVVVVAAVAVVKSLPFEALTVSDLQRSLEAQAFKICLLKFFAVRKNYKIIEEGCLEPLETQEWFIIVTRFIIGTHGLGKGNPF